jgi:hypothetical protein
MNDLFVVLIILFAIISFLNKIFGQKKQQPTTRRQPIPQQKPKEWIPPWLEPDETEIQIPESKEEEFDVIEAIEYKQPSFDKLEQKKTFIMPTTLSEKKSEPIFQEKTEEIDELPLEALDIELSSKKELRRGIILAEILGPCRARRKPKRI